MCAERQAQAKSDDSRAADGLSAQPLTRPVYLVSGAACVVQMPMRRQFLLPAHVLDGDGERRMIEVVVGNEALGIRTQNLVSVAVRDTFISLVALLLVLLLNLRA